MPFKPVAENQSSRSRLTLEAGQLNCPPGVAVVSPLFLQAALVNNRRSSSVHFRFLWLQLSTNELRISCGHYKASVDIRIVRLASLLDALCAI